MTLHTKTQCQHGQPFDLNYCKQCEDLWAEIRTTAKTLRTESEGTLDRTADSSVARRSVELEPEPSSDAHSASDRERKT